MTVSNRRIFLISSLAVLAAPRLALAHKPTLAEKFLPQLVNTRRKDWRAGNLHVVPDEFFLYFMLNDGLAIRYGVGVGRDRLYTPGTFTVARKAKWPFWRPTQAMIRREPEKYAKYSDGMKGGPDNPLGARALYLYRNNRYTFNAIHGTTAPRSIGRSVSNGCVRMINDHVIDLYQRVPVGAKVTVL